MEGSEDTVTQLKINMWQCWHVCEGSKCIWGINWGGYYLENYLPGIFNLVVEDYSTVRIKAELDKTLDRICKRAELSLWSWLRYFPSQGSSFLTSLEWRGWMQNNFLLTLTSFDLKDGTITGPQNLPLPLPYYLISFVHLPNHLLLHSCFTLIMSQMVSPNLTFSLLWWIFQMTLRLMLWKNGSYQVPPLFKNPEPLQNQVWTLLPCNGHTWQIYFPRWLNIDPPPLGGSVERGMI